MGRATEGCRSHLPLMFPVCGNPSSTYPGNFPEFSPEWCSSVRWMRFLPTRVQRSDSLPELSPEWCSSVRWMRFLPTRVQRSDSLPELSPEWCSSVRWMRFLPTRVQRSDSLPELSPEWCPSVRWMRFLPTRVQEEWLSSWAIPWMMFKCKMNEVPSYTSPEELILFLSYPLNDVQV